MKKIIFIILALFMLFSIIKTLIEGIIKKDYSKITLSILIVLFAIFSFFLIIFYVFLAEAGPSEPPITLMDHIIVIGICFSWSIASFFLFKFTKIILLKIVLIFQMALTFILVLVGMFGSLNVKGFDEIDINRIICTSIITILFILLFLPIKIKLKEKSIKT